MRALAPALALLLLAACSQEERNDVPPIPEPTAESANQLMAEAEKASANAAARAEPKAPPERSAADNTTNEVTP
ncbi:hypothetical protein [Sphingomonas astaxanthinifaciens]|uniref:Lipoprotein n=1 Tax=Sphingomonas astaxanthinifaciens DSM 22298 TaxID=1123267 RepID=A0ABQ5Z941_9SPHN|nr:hypothetical protein [Sphingomonas astaxanthinifaciens]GLR48452.1 hypothetical protein GCM10007925_21680 [Sphingomonas astaxanthinifaciens DSM 22298]